MSRRGSRPPKSSSISEEWHRQRPDLDQSIFLPTVQILVLARIMEDDFDTRCRERFQLSANDMRVLLALRRLGPPFAMRPTDLFRALLVTSGAITKQVDRLSALGLVTRVPDPSYQRGFLIRITKSGMKMADRAATMTAEDTIASQALGQIDPNLLRSGARFLNAFVNRVEELRAEAQSRMTERGPRRSCNSRSKPPQAKATPNPQ